MNALIYSFCHYTNYVPKLVGSLFDAIEYYLIIREYNKDFKLFISPFYVGENKLLHKKNNPIGTCESIILNTIKDIVDAKYDVNDDTYLDNIEIIDLNKIILTHSFDKLLLLDMATPRKIKKSFVRAKEVHILTEKTTEEYFYTSKHNKVIYHTEMPFCYSDISYNMKFAYDLFKPINNFKNTLYVNYAKKDYKLEPELVELVNSYNKPIFEKIYGQNHYNLHELFDEYVYIKSDRWFDTHPRLFHECKFYGKQFYYHNFLNIKDGSYYRYHAAKEESWKERNLTKNDSIVMEMIN